MLDRYTMSPLKEEVVMLILSVACTLESVGGTYPVYHTHRGPHECGGVDGRCCPGWSRTGHSRLCLTPMCRGCGSGICSAPNLCACPDGSVQPSCPTAHSDARSVYPAQVSLCQNFGCEQECTENHGIPHCICMSGFAVDNDGRSCRDIDECHEGPRMCYQGCINTAGSFMCTCFRGFTLTDNGRSCRKLHDYRNSPCGTGKRARDRPCEIHQPKPQSKVNVDSPCGQSCGSPSYTVQPVVQRPRLQPCRSDGLPCGSSRGLDVQAPFPCVSDSSPCDPNSPDIPFSVENIPPPPCGPESHPCGSTSPCGSDVQPCVAVPQVPTVVEKIPFISECHGSNCDPNLSPELFPEFTDTEILSFPCVGRDCDTDHTAPRVSYENQPCTSGACQFKPEIDPEINRFLDPIMASPSPCMSETCLHGHQTRTRNRHITGQSAQFNQRMPEVLPPFPVVPRGIYPCPRSGCPIEYDSFSTSAMSSDVSHRIQSGSTNSNLIDKGDTVGSRNSNTAERVHHRSNYSKLRTAVLSPQSRPSYRVDPITGNFNQNRGQYDRRNTGQDIKKHEARALRRNTQHTAKQSDQFSTPTRRREVKQKRINKQRRNKRLQRKKTFKNGKSKRLRSRINRKSTDQESHTNITTMSSPVDYSPVTSTTTPAIESNGKERTSFEDKVKSFLTEFTKLRSRQRRKISGTRHNGEGRGEEHDIRAGERRRQGRICRDDLCTSYIRTSGTDAEAVTCPPGYQRRVEGSYVYCQAVYREEVSDDSPGVISRSDIPEMTGSTMTPDISHHAIPPTMDTSSTPEVDNAIIHVPTSTPGHEPVQQPVVCPDDQVVVNFEGGVVCQNKDTQTPPTPMCLQGQSATRSGMGYLCAAAGEVRPVCGKGTTLTRVKGRFICENIYPVCTTGESRVLTSVGWKCVGNQTAISCPEGLDPVDTPVGRVCQYTGQQQSIPSCPPDQQLVRTRAGYTCNYGDVSTTQVPSRKCSPGFISVDKTEGQRCIKDPTLKLGVVSCPVGFRMSRDECQPVGADIGRGEQPPCPLGQHAVFTDSGRICQYRNQGRHENRNNAHTGTHIRNQGNSGVSQTNNLNNPKNNPGESIISHDNLARNHGNSDINNENEDSNTSFRDDAEHHDEIVTRCPHGQILTQKRNGFFCDFTTVDVTEWICSPREIIVQLTSDLDCVEVSQTNIVCGNDRELGWSHKDQEFTCLRAFISEQDEISSITQSPISNRKTQAPPKGDNPFLCAIGEIKIIDDEGRRCVVMETDDGLCGDAYIVQTLENGQKICKARTMNLKCPDGYELVTSGQSPECVAVGGSTEPLSPCEDSYSIIDDSGRPKCFLAPEDPECSGEKKTSRCGRSLESLNMSCIPQCSNGGVCVDGSCICPPGVTGVACQLDVDECRQVPRDHCQYNCQNTFGSYHCACPPGRTLNADGRTCKDAECTPGCLNGGFCRDGTCHCTAGFEGIFCQTDIDECSRHSGLCQHHCRNTQGGYACVCSPGSRLRQDGRTCVNTTCIPECRNGGQCIHHRCQCPRGYQGITCQLDINECLELPCSHICTNLPGSYVCSCPTGFELGTDLHTCFNSTIPVI